MKTLDGRRLRTGIPERREADERSLLGGGGPGSLPGERASRLLHRERGRTLGDVQRNVVESFAWAPIGTCDCGHAQHWEKKPRRGEEMDEPPERVRGWEEWVCPPARAESAPHTRGLEPSEEGGLRGHAK